MRRYAHITLSLVLLCTVVLQQQLAADDKNNGDNESTQESGSFRIVSVVPLNGQSVRNSVIAPFRCDGDGNLYFRAYDPKAVFRTPITKYNNKGSLEATFSVLDLDQKLQGRDFFVTPEGDVFQIIEKSEESFIAVYKKDGTLKSRVKLEGGQFRPRGPLAVFPSGEFLVSGMEPATAGGRRSTPFVGVFRSDGTLVRRVTMPADEASNEIDQSKKSVSIYLGDSVVGSDGNVYVLRRTVPAKIYGISGTGEITKSLTVNGKVEPENIYESHGKLAVLFGLKKGDLTVKVIDLQSGTEAGSYQVQPPLGPMMFCYSDSTFRFMSGSNANLAIYTAEPL